MAAGTMSLQLQTSLYMNKNGDDTYLQMAGNASNSYKKLSVVEKKAIHGRTAAFFSCGMREWQSESRYSKDVSRLYGVR